MRTEDGTIIEKCLNGEPEAFGILVDKYKAGIFSTFEIKPSDFNSVSPKTAADCDKLVIKRLENYLRKKKQ